MKKENRKQIILIAIAFICIGIGWFNMHHQQTSIEVAAEDTRNEINLGDVQLVNSEVYNENKENKYLSEIVPNEEIQEQEVVNNTGNQSISQVNNIDSENVELEKNKEEYFIETKLQRDTMYSEMLETYQKMLENAEVGETQKAIASQEIANITNMKNGIMISENLIKNKGFENVVILVNNGIASVIVKSPLLNQEQIAKIQNIVSRELNIEVQNINISNK